MMGVLALPISLAVAFGGLFVANEFGHGAVAETLGFGHHHMLDAGGYHCVDHNDPDQGPRHMEHMHNQTGDHAHGGCHDESMTGDRMGSK